MRTHLLLIGLLALGCDDDGPENVQRGADAATADVGPAPDAGLSDLVEEARATGLLRYLEAPPVEPAVESTDDDITVYLYPEQIEPRGPLCMRGKPFRFSVRDTGSDKLLVFLQGGGACWSDFCLAVTSAPGGVPAVDVLNTGLESNPLADWNVVYLPYCDGSLFAGDADVDEDEDGEADRFHRGLQNLSGALAVARERFPAPSEVMLVGSSAGGYGTIPGSILLRAAYPDAPLSIFSDSGTGVARPGEPAFIDGILDEHGITPLLPASCVDCSGDGHITRLVDWILARDANLRWSVFSAYYDLVIGRVFLDIDAELLRDTLVEQTGWLHARHPDQYKRFLVDGVAHTALLGSPSGVVGDDFGALEFDPDVLPLLAELELGGLDRTAVGDVTMGDWLRAFVERGEGWVDLAAEPGEPPEW